MSTHNAAAESSLTDMLDGAPVFSGGGSARPSQLYHQIISYNVDRDAEGQPVVGSKVVAFRVSTFGHTMAFGAKSCVRHIPFRSLFKGHASWVNEQVNRATAHGMGQRQTSE